MDTEATTDQTGWKPGDPIDYAAPGCVCASGGMGRRGDCPVHGTEAARLSGEPGVFTTRSGMTRQWATARSDLLESHGIPRDQKGVNVARGLLMIDVRLGGRWVPLTDDKSVVLDRMALQPEGIYRVRIADTGRSRA